MRKTTIIIVFAACMIATIAKGLGAQPHATSAEQDRHSSFSSTTHYPGSKMVEIAMARLRDAETAASLAEDGRAILLSEKTKRPIANYKHQALALLERGEFREAIRTASVYLYLGKEQKDEGHLAYAKLLLASAYLFSGNNELANEYASNALDHWVWPQWRNNAHSSAYKILGDVAFRRGDHQKAISLYEKSVDLADDMLRFYSRAALSSAHIAAGNLDQGAKALKEAEGYVSILTRTGQLSASNNLLRLRGSLALKEGKPEDASHLFEKALQNISESHDSPYERFWLMEGNARAKAASGYASAALQNNLDAIKESEKVRARFRSEEFKTGLFGEMQDVFGRTVQLLMESGQPEQAWEISEQSRSRALLDMIRNRVRIEHNGIALADSYSKPVKIQDFSSMLNPNDLVVSYHMLEDQGYIWAVRKSGLSAYAIPIGKASIAKLIQEFRSAVLAQSSETRKLGGELYDLLVKPLKLTDKEAITFVPHDVLHYLPFQALWTGDRYLIQRNPISYAPSVASLVVLTERQIERKGKFFALGNPDVGDPALALPGAQREVEALGKLFPDSEVLVQKNATREIFMKVAGLSRLVHVAAHGTADPIDPLSSKLFLAGSSVKAGALEAKDVYSMKLDNTALVTLSACETGLGSISRGDEIWGFTRSFLSAGTQSLLVSLWPVSDESTELLMSRFYKELSKGIGVRLSLRDAILEVLVNPKFSAPFYWAPFNLVGNPR
ncbi:MAG: hypothetical protein MOGDAGHF_01549 [Rhodocyclaceae bacterium]|nr:hypothetical protein [Rhodocyclaceae bacterium]